MNIKPYRWWILSGILLLLSGSLIFATYHFRWAGTGFLNKTLWDWLSLLIIPLVLAVIALLFNLANTRTERQVAQQRYKQDQQIAKQRYEQDQQIAQQRYEQDQQIALEKQREDLLQIYLDRISELLLKEGLRTSSADDEMRNVARVRTLTVLPRLDKSRKSSLIRFLYESHLIKNEEPIIVLDGADLSKANLNGANLNGAYLNVANLSEAALSKANLNGANLNGAYLNVANLSGANLSGANLSGAKVTQEQLQKAKSLRGATLPDGTIYHETLQTN